MELDVVCVLWLLGVAIAMFFARAALRLYLASELVLFAPSVLYLLLMLFGGHAVPPISILLLQAIIVALFSALPLYWSIALIRKEKAGMPAHGGEDFCRILK